MDRTVVQPFRDTGWDYPPKTDFHKVVRQALYPHAGGLLPERTAPASRSFYPYYVSTLKEQGFDFLKVDNQAFTLLYMRP